MYQNYQKLPKSTNKYPKVPKSMYCLARLTWLGSKMLEADKISGLVLLLPQAPSPSQRSLQVCSDSGAVTDDNPEQKVKLQNSAATSHLSILGHSSYRALHQSISTTFKIKLLNLKKKQNQLCFEEVVLSARNELQDQGEESWKKCKNSIQNSLPPGS